MLCRMETFFAVKQKQSQLFNEERFPPQQLPVGGWQLMLSGHVVYKN